MILLSEGIKSIREHCQLTLFCIPDKEILHEIKHYLSDRVFCWPAQRAVKQWAQIIITQQKQKKGTKISQPLPVSVFLK